jgi:Tol biopolymer transport system component
VVFDTTIGRDTHLVARDLVTGQQREITAERGWQWAGAISPDGKRVAYLHQQSGQAAAHVVPIEGGPTRLLVAGSVRPSWSPDGRAVWAGSTSAPVRVDAETGAVTRTLSGPPGYDILGAIELADGRVVARLGKVGQSVSRGLGLYAPGASDAPRVLTDDALTEAVALSLDGRWAIAGRPSGGSAPQVVAYPLAGGPPAILPESRVAPNAGMTISRAGDRLIWSTCNTRSNVAALVRQPGGVATAQPIGGQSEWVDQQPAWVPGSTRLVIVSERLESRRLWVLDRPDREPARPLPTGPRMVDAPAVSPDGRWVAFAQVGDGVYVVPLDGSAPPRRLTSGADDGAPCFSRDGAIVYFQTLAPDGRPRVAAIPLEGGVPRPIREGAARPATTPGADLLAFLAVEGTSREGTGMLLDLDTGLARPLSPRLGPARSIHLSPDGRRAVLVQGSMSAVEIDVASGSVLLRYDAGSDEISGLTYVGDEIVMTQRQWAGNLWIGDDPFL